MAEKTAAETPGAARDVVPKLVLTSVGESGSPTSGRKRPSPQREALNFINSELMTLSCIGVDERTPRSIALTSGENRVMRMPDQHLMFKAQKSFHDMLADIHEDPNGFEDFIHDIRSEMKPHTDVVPSPFDSQTGCLGDYVVNDENSVGRGRFSVVYFATRKRDARPCAVKKINWGHVAGGTVLSPAKCLKEVGLLRSLNHPNVVHYLDSFLHDQELYIVLEWAGRGDLKTLITDSARRKELLGEGTCWSLFSQVAEAVRHCHEKRIIHRDIKPSNCFIMEDGSLKLGDLGLGRYLDLASVLAFSQVGTPLYMSPEVLRGEGHHFASDVWSLGCLLYELATLRSPFAERGLTMDKLFLRIVGGQVLRPSASHPYYGARVRRMVESMLAMDPSQRPDMGWVSATSKLALGSTERAAELQRAAANANADAAEAEAGAGQQQPALFPVSAGGGGGGGASAGGSSMTRLPSGMRLEGVVGRAGREGTGEALVSATLPAPASPPEADGAAHGMRGEFALDGSAAPAMPGIAEGPEPASPFPPALAPDGDQLPAAAAAAAAATAAVGRSEEAEVAAGGPTHATHATAAGWVGGGLAPAKAPVAKRGAAPAPPGLEGMEYNAEELSLMDELVGALLSGDGESGDDDRSEDELAAAETLPASSESSFRESLSSADGGGGGGGQPGARSVAAAAASTASAAASKTAGASKAAALAAASSSVDVLPDAATDAALAARAEDSEAVRGGAPAPSMPPSSAARSAGSSPRVVGQSPRGGRGSASTGALTPGGSIRSLMTGLLLSPLRRKGSKAQVHAEPACNTAEELRAEEGGGS